MPTEVKLTVGPPTSRTLSASLARHTGLYPSDTLYPSNTLYPSDPSIVLSGSLVTQ